MEEPASSIFEKLINRGRKKDIKTTIIGVRDADDQLFVENWLRDPHTQEFLQDLKHEQTKSLGIVTKVNKYNGTTQVHFFDQTGQLMGFDYDPQDEIFSDAPNGFQKDDIIVQTREHGIKIVKVKVIKPKPKTELKIIRRFMQIGYKHLNS